MRILFISELFPAPGKGGEFIRNYGLCQLLERSTHEIFFLLGQKFHQPDAWKIEAGRFRIFDFSLHYTTKSQLSDTFLKFKRQPLLLKEFDEVIDQFSPDVAFIDYYYYGQYIPYFKRRNIPVIYGTHNVQPRLTLQTPVKRLRSRVMKHLVYRLLQYNESKYLKMASAIICVSQPDLEFYQQKVQSVRSFLIPNFLVEDDYKIQEGQKADYIIMTGNFHAFQNFEGLKWFLKYVWNQELAEKTELKIAGLNSIPAVKEITREVSCPPLTAVGEVDDMKPYISKAKASLVPLLHGSGTRLKCIESMALKTQLVSTSQGAEGIDHQDSILIANDPLSFRKHLIEVLNGKVDLSAKAYGIFQEKYSLEANAAVFEDILHHVSGQ